MNENFGELLNQIQQHRPSIQTTFKIARRNEFDADSERCEKVIDAFVRSLGFTPPSQWNDDWTELAAKEAHYVLNDALYRDLAYDSEIMSKTLADEISTQ